MWELLGIQQTDDEDIIRKAYAEKSKDCHPEEHPEEFQQLHKAYKNAIRYAKNSKKQKKQLSEEMENNQNNSQDETQKKQEETELDYSQIFGRLKKQDDENQDKKISLEIYETLDRLILRDRAQEFAEWEELLQRPQVIRLLNKKVFFYELVKFIKGNTNISSQMKEIILKTISRVIEDAALQEEFSQTAMDEKNMQQKKQLFLELHTQINIIIRTGRGEKPEDWKELFERPDIYKGLNQSVCLYEFTAFIMDSKQLLIDVKQAILLALHDVIEDEESKNNISNMLKKLIAHEKEEFTDKIKADLYKRMERIIARGNGTFVNEWQQLFTSPEIANLLQNQSAFSELHNFVLNNRIPIEVKKTIAQVLNIVVVQDEFRSEVSVMMQQIEKQEENAQEYLIQKMLSEIQKIYNCEKTKNSILAWNYIFTVDEYQKILQYPETLIRLTDELSTFEKVNREIWSYIIKVTYVSKKNDCYEATTGRLKKIYRRLSLRKYRCPTNNLTLGEVKKVLYGRTVQEWHDNKSNDRRVGSSSKNTNKKVGRSVAFAIFLLIGASYNGIRNYTTNHEKYTQPVPSYSSSYKTSNATVSGDTLRDLTTEFAMIGDEKAKIDYSQYEKNYRIGSSGRSNLDANGDGIEDKLMVSSHMITLTLGNSKPTLGTNIKRTFDVNSEVILCGRNAIKTVTLHERQKTNSSKSTDVNYIRYWKYFELTSTGYDIKQTMEESYKEDTGEYVTVVNDSDTGEKVTYTDTSSARSSSPKHDSNSVWYDDNKDSMTLLYE